MLHNHKRKVGNMGSKPPISPIPDKKPSNVVPHPRSLAGISLLSIAFQKNTCKFGHEWP